MTVSRTVAAGLAALVLSSGAAMATDVPTKIDYQGLTGMLLAALPEMAQEAKPAVPVAASEIAKSQKQASNAVAVEDERTVSTSFRVVRVLFNISNDPTDPSRRADDVIAEGLSPLRAASGGSMVVTGTRSKDDLIRALTQNGVVVADNAVTVISTPKETGTASSTARISGLSLGSAPSVSMLDARATVIPTKSGNQIAYMVNSDFNGHIISQSSTAIIPQDGVLVTMGWDKSAKDGSTVATVTMIESRS